MSLAMMTWAFAQRGLRPSEKVVLLALADYANDEGYCFPGQVSIATKADLSERTVRDTLKRLEDAGLLEITERRRDDGYRTSNGYRLLTSPAEVAGDQISPAESRQSHRQTAAGQEPSVEPSDIPPTPKAEDDGFDAVWAAWPRKDGKLAAQKAWRRLSAAKRAEILPMLVAHANGHRQHTEPRYIPHLSTWLNGERWDDTVPGGPAASAPTAIDVASVDPSGPVVYREGRAVIPPGYVIVRDDHGRATGYRKVGRDG